MSEELIPVNILIGDRTYRIRVPQSEEEGLRRTVKKVNDKILEFKSTYAGKDMQDYIAMVMIWLATLTMEQPQQWTDFSELDSVLDKLEKTIDNCQPVSNSASEKIG
jgi:cell division protein ZapA (FtsZ GTPase activity inhibitor)